MQNFFVANLDWIGCKLNILVYSEEDQTLLVKGDHNPNKKILTS